MPEVTFAGGPLPNQSKKNIDNAYYICIKNI